MLRRLPAAAAAALLLLLLAGAAPLARAARQLKQTGPTCPDGYTYEQILGKCIASCKSGYIRTISAPGQCIATGCPEGFEDSLFRCKKPDGYGRGVGWAWWPEYGFSSDGMLARCKNGYASDTPQCAPAPNPVCEVCGAIAYPVCKKGLQAVGCNLCEPVSCPDHMTDGIYTSDGPGWCTKDTYTPDMTDPTWS